MIRGGSACAPAAPLFDIVASRDIARFAHWPGLDSELAACTVFQTREFLESWLASYGTAPGIEPHFVEVRERDGAVLALLPLAIVRHGRTRELTFADLTACDYNAPVLFPTARAWTAATAAALWSEIAAALPAHDLVTLAKMPAAVEGRANPLFLLAAEANPESCHGADLSGSWEEAEATLANLRTIRRQTRGLERLAPLQLRFAATPGERELVLRTMLEQKQRRFEETRVPGFAEHPEKAAFLREATARLGGGDGLRLFSLRLGDEILATGWGLKRARSFTWIVISSAAGRWARSSPGRVLHRLLLQHLHAEGCRYCDYGIGDEAWKLENRNRTVPLRLHVAALSPRGAAFLLRRRLVERLRASPPWRRLRPYKWVVLRRLAPMRRRADPP